MGAEVGLYDEKKEKAKIDRKIAAEKHRQKMIELSKLPKKEKVPGVKVKEEIIVIPEKVYIN